MLERKASGDKVRKNSGNTKKRIPCAFSRLFPFSDVGIPLELQRFVSSERRLSKEDFARNNPAKVRVILKINEIKDAPSCLSINKNQNCVGLIDPTPSRRSHASNSNINLFPFDFIFTEGDQQSTFLSNAIVDPILDFFKGKDACIFTFGNTGLGKTKTMIGSDQSMGDLGVIPCALVWVYKVMEQLKTSGRTRYAIRISALEIANKNVVKDLLSCTEGEAWCEDTDNPGQLLQERPNTLVNNQKEMPAGSLLDATRILDQVLSARSCDFNDSLTHLQLIIHLYQYQMDANRSDEPATIKPVLGGRSRLHFLDLGSGRHSNDDSSILSLQGMSKVILALYTSQRHIPYKDNVLTQLLKETLSVNTATTMLVHISSKEQNYNDTLQIVQLASKLYRTKSRKSRSVGLLLSDETSSCSSSSSGFHSRRLRPHMGIGAARRSSGNSSASSELDLTSASELSCCETVIFRGNVNTSGSDRSLEHRSVRQNPKSASSESDLIVSDKESLKDFISSSPNVLSPSAIRKRKISPRTNAMAWPSPSGELNTASENGPELWVDGPNAVYKSDRKQSKDTYDFTDQKSISKGIITDFSTQNINKPVMISKETQCDDVWDSSSSLTDGSSHSNTLDRKDHRPLSDISECTEDTESNVATETDIIKMNIMNDICPINDLDDLLESTFGVSPLHEDTKPQLSEKEINYSFGGHHITSLNQIFAEKDKYNRSNNDKILEPADRRVLNIALDNEATTSILPVNQAEEVKKHYHSASDSKRSSKSEQKERKNKSKCKKCSKKSNNEPSTSMSLSNSTDFSRVASWIQKVEYEIQSSGQDTDDVFLDSAKPYEYNLHKHHRSQPDVSSKRDRPNACIPRVPMQSFQYQYPPDSNWADSPSNHVRYSLYGGFQMHPITQESLTYQVDLPSSTCVPHVSAHSTTVIGQPFHSPKRIREHVQPAHFPYNRHSVSASQPPLPPVPQQMPCMDNRAPLRTTLNTPATYETQRISSSPSQVVRQPKCKTLPRDMYSDPISPLKRNKSDLHQSKTSHSKEQSMAAMFEIKSREKVKKESKNIMSILFAPFISLRNKINKSKCGSDKPNNDSEHDTDKSLQSENKFCQPIEPQWPTITSKVDPEFVLTSPYHLVTPPKTSTLPTESSGHGSDSSSLQNRAIVKGRSSETSNQYKCRNKSSNNNSKATARQRPTSSGYGSIIIKGDSEQSSHNDSSSEYSLSGPNNSKVLGGQSRIKHSVSLSNCKAPTESNSSSGSKTHGFDTNVENSSSFMNESTRLKNIVTAQDLIVREKLRISLNEERKLVIQYIETNRLRGISVDASVMNLACFKGIDNFEISNSTNRGECQSIIEQIDQEIEQLKKKLNQAQNHLLLITTFDSKL